MIGIGPVTATGTATGMATSPAGVRKAATIAEPSFATVMKDFLAEARMTPQQRIRREVLKEHRLTEESLATMSPAERKAIEEKIAPIIRRRVELAEDIARREGKQIALPSL